MNIDRRLEGNEEEWVELKQTFQLQHDFNNSAILRHWLEDRDKFVQDHMDVVKASYEAGYLDALDDAKDAIREMQRKFSND